eukprot:scaffold155881_cov27-Tisochrysis_lutea.AAC.6
MTTTRGEASGPTEAGGGKAHTSAAWHAEHSEEGGASQWHRFGAPARHSASDGPNAAQHRVERAAAPDVGRSLPMEKGRLPPRARRCRISEATAGGYSARTESPAASMAAALTGTRAEAPPPYCAEGMCGTPKGLGEGLPNKPGVPGAVGSEASPTRGA